MTPPLEKIVELREPIIFLSDQYRGGSELNEYRIFSGRDLFTLPFKEVKGRYWSINGAQFVPGEISPHYYENDSPLFSTELPNIPRQIKDRSRVHILMSENVGFVIGDPCLIKIRALLISIKIIN